MSIERAPIESHCAICGHNRSLEQELQVIWLSAGWSAMNDRSQQTSSDRWFPVCEECAAAATTFRVSFPLDSRQHEQRLFRLVITFGVTLAVLSIVLVAGKSLVNSDPADIRLVYAAGWLLVGYGTVLTFLLGTKVLSFELSGRRAWSGPWIEKQLIRLLELPQGDRAPYWWRIDLPASLTLRRIPPPPPPPPPAIDPQQSVTISIFPG